MVMPSCVEFSGSPLASMDFLWVFQLPTESLAPASDDVRLDGLCS